MTMKRGHRLATVDVTGPQGQPHHVAAGKAAPDRFGSRFVVPGGKGA